MGGSRASCRQASCRQDVRSWPNGGRQPQRRDERSWVLRSRAPGRDLPQRQGNRRSGHRRFSRWHHAGVRERVLKALTTDRDNQDRLIDSTVRPHQQAASGKAGPGIRRRDVPEADGPPSPLYSSAASRAARRLVGKPTGKAGSSRASSREGRCAAISPRRGRWVRPPAPGRHHRRPTRRRHGGRHAARRTGRRRRPRRQGL